MARRLVLTTCGLFLALALPACHSEPAESAGKTARLSVPAAPTAAPAAFRNLGKRAESES